MLVEDAAPSFEQSQIRGKYEENNPLISIVEVSTIVVGEKKEEESSQMQVNQVKKGK